MAVAQTLESVAGKALLGLVPGRAVDIAGLCDGRRTSREAQQGANMQDIAGPARQDDAAVCQVRRAI